MKEPATPRWTVHEARADSDAEVLRLFEQVFGHAMPLAEWQWKYAHAPLRGTLLRRDGEVVAFYGGMPRTVQGPEGVLAAVQNGDVMVRPEDRGVFTRRGAIYQVTQAFLQQHIGPGRTYALGYGFPNERAFGVAERLGLYIEGDRLHTLSWSPHDAPLSFWRREEDLAPDRLDAVDTLWRTMRRHWPQPVYIPERSAAHWRYRYVEPPGRAYVLKVVRQRFTRRPLAALALREHPDHVQWLDYVGHPKHVALALACARRFAARCGNKPLTALCSQSIVPILSIDVAGHEPSRIVVPLRAPEPGWPQPYPWQGRLWLMGGDTDFL